MFVQMMILVWSWHIKVIYILMTQFQVSASGPDVLWFVICSICLKIFFKKKKNLEYHQSVKEFGSKSAGDVADQYQAWSDSKLFDVLIVFQIDFFQKISRRQKKSCKITSHANLKLVKVAFLLSAWLEIFWIIPKFKILRLTFYRKSASKSWI